VTAKGLAAPASFKRYDLNVHEILDSVGSTVLFWPKLIHFFKGIVTLRV
jgi:hypothetical protein